MKLSVLSQPSFRRLVLLPAFVLALTGAASAQGPWPGLTWPATDDLAPPVTVSAGMFPRSGGPGSAVTVIGDFAATVPNYQAYTKEDILCVSRTNEEVEDEQFIVARTDAKGPNFLRGTVEHVASAATSRELEFRFGSGAHIAVPSLDGQVFYPEPVRAWSGLPNDPVVVSSQHFGLEPNYIDLPCGDVPTIIRQPFVLGSDGCLRAQLPGSGACRGDKLALDLLFDTNVKTVSANVPFTSKMPGASPWASAGFYLTFPGSWALNAASSGCTITLDPGTREIVVCPDPGVTITSVYSTAAVVIELDEAEHTLFIGGQGDSNWSSNGASDVALYSTEFGNWGVPYGGHPVRPFDSGGCNKWFFATLDVFHQTYGDVGSSAFDGEIRSAVLEIRIKATSCNTATDHIQIGWDGDPAAAGALFSNRLENLDDLGQAWQAGDEAVLCFDLSDLPNPNPHRRNVLDEIALRDAVDIMVDDDTLVSYVELRVLRCNP